VSLTHLGCPGCGGPLTLAEGQRLVTCRYCGGSYLVVIPGATPRYVVAGELDREAARQTAQRFLQEASLPRALSERGRIQELTLCFVPFYEWSGVRLGRFLLREQDERPAPVKDEGQDDGQLARWLLARPGETQETRVILQDALRIRSACDLPELGVDRIPLEALRRSGRPVPLEPYDLVKLQTRGVVFAPTRGADQMAADALRRIPVPGDRTAVVEQRLRVLYYPVWQARYLYRGRSYEIVIDGVRGTILRARAPRQLRQVAAVAVGALAVAAFCFGRSGRDLLPATTGGEHPASWITTTLGVGVGLVIGGAVAACLAWMAWRIFQTGEESLWGEGQGGLTVSTVGAGGGGVWRILLEQLLGVGPR